MEPTGIEPVTSCLQRRSSASEFTVIGVYLQGVFDGTKAPGWRGFARIPGDSRGFRHF